MRRVIVLTAICCSSTSAAADRFRSHGRSLDVHKEAPPEEGNRLTRFVRGMEASESERNKVEAELSFGMSLDSDRAPTAAFAAEFTWKKVGWHPGLQVGFSQEDELSRDGTSSGELSASFAPPFLQRKNVVVSRIFAVGAVEETVDVTTMTSDTMIRGGPEVKIEWKHRALTVEPDVMVLFGEQQTYRAELVGTAALFPKQLPERLEASVGISSESTFDAVAPAAEIAAAVKVIPHLKVTAAVGYVFDDEVLGASLALKGDVEVR